MDTHEYKWYSFVLSPKTDAYCRMKFLSPMLRVLPNTPIQRNSRSRSTPTPCDLLGFGAVYSHP